ncbi:MAG TPA: DUF3047 domain-containing protein [Syntrophales bacterium]|nr:DUF3047 domain-containing protein [Syntrophales bacterium]HON23914.1 DUF3047 domain-containing protein [Syntrophales bacterium]HOU78022.1 DUF3047 domain-containing protein [Syntrophales bacterium]HPC33015.1 DUF3047 domain-containing protein [Syntrophales bacterium]HQG34365.1 DUF3047 domain-containing protein [Syntrophales bacterium]
MFTRRIPIVFLLAALTVFLTAGELHSIPAEAVVVAKYRHPQLINGVPEGWKLMRHSGTPNIDLVREGDAYFVKLKSDPRSGFGIERNVRVDLKEYPYLNWTWRATRLPRGGDIRKSGTDDQVLQIYVVLPATGFPHQLNTPILTYIWDNEAPKGLTVRSPKPLLKKIRYLVVRNKTDRLGSWYTEKRNVYEDYKRIFSDVRGGEPLGATHGVRFYINSQNTRSYAEGYIGEVYFSKN